LSGGYLLCIGLAVDKAQRMGGDQVLIHNLVGAVVEQHFQPLFRRQAEMIAAFRADLFVDFQVFLINKRAATLAFSKNALGPDSLFFLFCAGDCRLLFFEPTHGFSS